MKREERIKTRRNAARVLQRLGGVSRREARAVVYGEGRATRHPTRRAALAARVGENAAAKRARRFRIASVAASVAVAEASF